MIGPELQSSSPGASAPGPWGRRLPRLGSSLVKLAEVAVVLMLVIALLTVLYYVKCVVGIDIFPDRHLADFLPAFLREYGN